MRVNRSAKILLSAGVFVCLSVAAWAADATKSSPAPAGAEPAGAAEYNSKVKPLLEKYCFDCHADGTEKGGVALDKYSSLTKHFSNYELWLSVWKNVDSQLMPPAKKAQPSEAERREIFQWIERAVFKVDPASPDPGRVTIRRLNREEYRNTIYDLLGVEFDTTEAFPADDTGYGFDTIGDVLNLSPILLEKYLDAAQEIVGDALEAANGKIPTIKLSPEQFKVRGSTNKTAKYLAFAKTATAETSQKIAHAGRYQITVDMRVTGSDEATVHTADVGLRVNGKEIGSRNVGWDYRKNILLTSEIDLKPGAAVLGLSIKEKRSPGSGENQLSLAINSVKIHGPLDGSVLEYPKDYYRLFPDGPPPADAAARHAYAQKIIRRLADHAFRRPVDEPTLNRLVTLAETTAKHPGMSFEKGIGQALTAVLASPRFLFRAEIQPEPNNPGRIVPVDEFALASRLSYLLWSSLPDDELFALAHAGNLRTNLRAQVDRMLKDRRSDRFIRNFVGQWLQTRDAATINVNASRILGIKNEQVSKVFGQRVRVAMRDETESLVAYILRENRSALELFTADYTFLNESLAKFYGIDGVKGTEMRKVSLKPGSHRGGVLTHASLLVVTSNPTRTSPVKRGLFVLENLLGTPAPPAPPNVPPLEDAKKGSKKQLTMRETMEIHREKPLCASCHARMDPIGLGLENFNALGQWRDKESGKTIDTAGQLITGEKFNNVAELSKIMATTRRMDFYRCLAEKLLTYAIGRGPEYYDSPTIDRLAEQLDREGGKLKTLVYGIVESAPFQKRRGDGEKLADAAGREPGK